MVKSNDGKNLTQDRSVNMYSLSVAEKSLVSNIRRGMNIPNDKSVV
jgi:hypothetical protein